MNKQGVCFSITVNSVFVCNLLDWCYTERQDDEGGGSMKVMGRRGRVPAAVILAFCCVQRSLVCLRNRLPVCLILSILFSTFLIQPTPLTSHTQ